MDQGNGPTRSQHDNGAQVSGLEDSDCEQVLRASQDKDEKTEKAFIINYSR